MKRLSILHIIAIAFCFCCKLNAQTVSKAISFEEKVYNFGNIEESKGKVSHTFIFRNIGIVPVVIDAVSAGCGCTTFSYTKEPVQPGKMGKVTITFNPLYRPGFFSKEIVVFSNNHANYTRIWVKGNVIPFLHPVEEDYPYSFGEGLYLNLKVLAFGSVTKGTTKQIDLRYANNSKKPMILSFVIDGNNKNIKLSNPGKLASLERGQINVSYTATQNMRGETIVNIYPVVNGKKLSHPLQAKITGIE